MDKKKVRKRKQPTQACRQPKYNYLQSFQIQHFWWHVMTIWIRQYLPYLDQQYISTVPLDQHSYITCCTILLSILAQLLRKVSCLINSSVRMERHFVKTYRLMCHPTLHKFHTWLMESISCFWCIVYTLHCEPKNTPKYFCHIFHKTRPILVRFGMYCPP